MEAGRVIGGKYRLRRMIGKGAMGSVWAAVHESLGRPVAVKLLHPIGVNPETAAARFVSEARIAAMVKHRFIVDIFDFGLTEDGISYMVLELLEGEELGERMYYGPPMSVLDAVRFVTQCLSGLGAVHAAGIVHRDLKPENIFIMQDADGSFPKLLDFGISKMSQDEGQLQGVSLRPPRMGGRPTQLTLPGTVIGTPWYMAPEQLRGARDIDGRADIYGMGVILWEWITGRVPHDDDNIGDLVISLASSGPPSLVTLRPELGLGLSDILGKAMAVRREERFQTVFEMREALLEVMHSLPQSWTLVQKSIANLSSKQVLGSSVSSPPPSFPCPVPALTEVQRGAVRPWQTYLSPALGRVVAWFALVRARWSWMSQPHVAMAAAAVGVSLCSLWIWTAFRSPAEPDEHRVAGAATSDAFLMPASVQAGEDRGPSAVSQPGGSEASLWVLKDAEAREAPRDAGEGAVDAAVERAPKVPQERGDREQTRPKTPRRLIRVLDF